jgi:hypothetical protein
MAQSNIPSARPASAGRRVTMRSTGARRVPPQVAQAGLPKALRIGLIQGGRIIEEQIIRQRETVFVGQSEKNRFVIAHPKLPAKYALFESKAGRYHINIKSFMGGRLSTPQGVVDLAGGGARRIPLDDRSRGKIVIGDATLLFQFVVPPPVQPRPQLPAAVRGFWLKQMINLFTPSEGLVGEIWLFSMLACVGMVVFFHVHDWPVEPQGFDLDNKFLALVVQPPEDLLDKDEGEKASEEGEGEGEAGEDEADNQESSSNDDRKGPKTPLTDEQKAALEAQRKARLEAAVKKSGILAALGSLGGDATGEAGSDLLRGSSVASDIDGVLSKVGSVRTASVGDVGGQLGGPAGTEGGGDAVELGGVKASQASGDVSSSDVTESKVKGKATVGAGEEAGGTGILDQAKVTKTVRARMGALRNCYEKALKKNPTLEGKISVKFTIGTSGRVTGAEAASDTLGDSTVTDCVVGKFRTFTFDKPEGGSVVYIYPIVFKPGG